MEAVAITTTRPATWVRLFYAVAGTLALLSALTNVMGPIGGALNGCEIVLDQRVTGPGMEAGCVYYLDPVAAAMPLAVGLVLVAAAWRYSARDGVSTGVTALAIPAGALAAAMPLVAWTWLVTFYRIEIGPTEIAIFALALAILGVGLLAGWRTVRHLAGRRAAMT